MINVNQSQPIRWQLCQWRSRQKPEINVLKSVVVWKVVALQLMIVV